MVPGALPAKVDLSNKYSMLPIHPDDQWLLGMQWEGNLSVEPALPFWFAFKTKVVFSDGSSVTVDY